jgi:type IV pilus assembly protein PilE
MNNRISQLIARGFTVIEIMVVLLIITILALAAYPGYQHAVIKTRRGEGKAALMKTMQKQEHYFSLHMRYLAFSAPAIASDGGKGGSTDMDAKANGFVWFSGESAATSAYEISAQACDDDIRDCVLLLATPGTGRVNADFHDAACGVLSLDSTGRKSANADQCW